MKRKTQDDAAQVGSQARKAVDTYQGLGASGTRQHSGGAQAAKIVGTKLSTMSHSRGNQAAGRLCGFPAIISGQTTWKCKVLSGPVCLPERLEISFRYACAEDWLERVTLQHLLRISPLKRTLQVFGVRGHWPLWFAKPGKVVATHENVASLLRSGQVWRPRSAEKVVSGLCSFMSKAWHCPKRLLLWLLVRGKLL